MAGLLEEALKTPGGCNAPARPRPAAAEAKAYAFNWDGSRGTLETGPLDDADSTRAAGNWDKHITDAGLDPDEVEVVEPVKISRWQAQTKGGGATTLESVKLTLQRKTRAPDGRGLDELVAALNAAPIAPAPEPTLDVDAGTFVLALGDLQLGKVDGDGVTGTILRFRETTAKALRQYLATAAGAPVLIAHLGDCIEGMVSQGGDNTWRTTLTTTEQVRLYRRLLLEQVRAFAAVAPELTVVGIPGNHDEAHRPIHTYGDSWALEAVHAVADACELAGGYEHVTFTTPARDELVLTLDLSGTYVTFAHGHQFKGAAATAWETWWSKQSFHRRGAAHADMLLAGHLHHLQVVAQSGRTFIRVPALESESTWYRHTAGAVGTPGVVTFVAAAGGWSDFVVHSGAVLAADQEQQG